MGEQSMPSPGRAVPAGRVGPWFLRSEDWRRAKRAGANVLLVGAPCSIAELIEALPDLQQPIVTWRAGERFSPPTADCTVGTMILSGVEALPPADQERLYQWLQRRSGEIQVLSTASGALLPLVDQGAFHDGLYYRLNTVCIEAGGHGPDEAASSWLRSGLLATAEGTGMPSDGWTLRVKPDRRREQLAVGDDRRRR